jgi:hypothetical protein
MVSVREATPATVATILREEPGISSNNTLEDVVAHLTECSAWMLLTVAEIRQRSHAATTAFRRQERPTPTSRISPPRSTKENPVPAMLRLSGASAQAAAAKQASR